MADVSVKMGVSGVAQFKQGMKESQAAVKSLDAQLKLNEASLKANGDQEAYLQTKAELLNKKIEEQKRYVDRAASALEAMKNNGVNKTSTAFQNMQTQLYKAQADLVNMETELKNVGESGEDAQSGVSHMNQSLQRIGTNVSFESVVEGIGKITGGLEAAAEKAIQLGKKMVQAMLSGGQWADDLQTTADQWEMTPEQVYRMRQTANVIDTSAETIFSARKKLIAAMGKEGNQNTMGAFAALGITNFTGTDENIEDVFWNAGEALMGFEDKVARNEYAMQIYGKSWEELIPIFKAGREEYEATMNSWQWFGDDRFKALTEMDEESERTRSAWENIQHTLEAAMAPAMTEIMVALQGMMSEFNKYLQSEAGQEMLTKLNEAVSGMFTELTSIDPQEVIGKITEIFDNIKRGLQWLIDNKQTVYDALKVIAAGFGLLKITELAANIGRVVSGLGGLTGGGKGESGGTETATTGAATASSGSGGWVSMYGKLSAVLLGYPVLKKISEEGTDWLNPWSDYYKDMDKKTGETLSIIAGKDMTDIYNRAMNPEKKENDWMPKISPFEENLQHYYADELIPHKIASANPLDDAKAAESMDKMTQVAGEMGQAANGSAQANKEMTDAANGLMTIPAEIYTQVYNAILAGMSNVTIVINQGAVDTIGRRIGGGMGRSVVAMVR